MNIEDFEKQEDKMAILRSDDFQKLPKSTKRKVLKGIKEQRIKSLILHDIQLMDAILDDRDFKQLMKTSTDEDKIYVLKNPGILKKFNVKKYEIRRWIESMSNDGKKTMLEDRDTIIQVGFFDDELSKFISEIEDDKDKIKFVKDYKLRGDSTRRVIVTCSDETKKSVILEENESLNVSDLESIMSSLGIDAFVEFVNNQHKFLEDKDIRVFNVIKRMTPEKQLELVWKIDEMGLSVAEKRMVFACLETSTKKAINPNNIAPEYRELLDIEISNDGMIIPDLTGDVSKYVNLDELLLVVPDRDCKSNEDRQILSELLRICPNVEIKDNISPGVSTVEEYIKGEEWVNFVLEGIKTEWTDVQKLAYIDTMIGKTVSYSPNYGTEVEKFADERTLWKVIKNGYGVCLGIAKLEIYLLARVGIEAEIVHVKGKHAFVKVKNIQIPTENGIVEGDTLVDPTWNLTASRYGGRPQHFCKSYEELRKVDIDADGKDHECHRNDGLEEASTVDMDDKSLREVYRSIGVADKDGKFPIRQLIENVRQIDETVTDMKSNIKSKFELLKKWCPEFAMCQNSTIDIIRGVLFNSDLHFEFKRCIASRVYDKKDAEKQFFYADKENMEFKELSQQEFERKFECYEKDMQKLKGNRRPWETEEKIQENKANSSGEIVAEDGR